MYRIVPINQTFDVRLIDRNYRYSFCGIDITLRADNEVDSTYCTWIIIMHVFEYDLILQGSTVETILLSSMCNKPWSESKPGSSCADLLRLVFLQASKRNLEHITNVLTCSATCEHIFWVTFNQLQPNASVTVFHGKNEGAWSYPQP